MPLIILLVLVGGAVLEVWVVLQVADLIGAALTALLLIASSMLGARVLGRGALQAWRRVADASQTGEQVGARVLDAGIVVVAGVLLLVPGLVSGALGLLLLLPPVRTLVRPLLGFLVLRRMTMPFVIGTRGAGWAAGQAGRRRPGASDVEGSATEQPRPEDVPRPLPESDLLDDEPVRRPPPPDLEGHVDEDGPR